MSGVVGDAGFVYFIATESGSAIKIGAAKDPDARLRSLQTGNHERLRLLKTIYCDEPELREAEYHRDLESARIRGEWFESDGVMAALDLPRDDLPFLEMRGVPAGFPPTVLRELLEESEAKRYALEREVARARGWIWRCAREIRDLTRAADELLAHICPWEEPRSDAQLAALEARWGSRV